MNHIVSQATPFTERKGAGHSATIMFSEQMMKNMHAFLSYAKPSRPPMINVRWLGSNSLSNPCLAVEKEVVAKPEFSPKHLSNFIDPNPCQSGHEYHYKVIKNHQVYGLVHLRVMKLPCKDLQRPTLCSMSSLGTVRLHL